MCYQYFDRLFWILNKSVLQLGYSVAKPNQKEVQR